MPSEHPTVCVFAPALFATVTVEQGEGGFDSIHFHLGGQGFWVARQVRELGGRPIICAPVGGESGDVLRGLVASTGLDFASVKVSGDSPAYVHDRRQGERVEVAMARSPELSRHEIDDLFGKTLRHAIAAGVCVITGRPAGNTLGPDLYRRLGVDLAAAKVRTIADFHGEELDAFLSGGPLDILKVSDAELTEDGVPLEDEGQVWETMDRLAKAGARSVVVSLGSEGALARFGDQRVRAKPPAFEVVDPAGAGDSMTAALAMSLVSDLSPVDSLRLACAAGAANVTRHGLGSSQAELVDRVAELVAIEELSGE